MSEKAQTDSTQPEAGAGNSSGPTGPSRRTRWLYGIALVLLYLVAVLPRLQSAGYDEPDLTHGDERLGGVGQAQNLLSTPNWKITSFQKAPGVAHFLFLAFKPYYWIVKGYFRWDSIDDVQWWRVRRYWRSLNIVLGGLVVVFAGTIGARAFNRRVGFLAAALCAASRESAIWFTLLKEEGLTALQCTIVLYCALRVIDSTSSRWRWVLLAGIASGTALAFKYTSAPVVFAFLLALFLSPLAPRGNRRRISIWLSKFHVVPISVYLTLTLAVFLAWFPQLILKTTDVLESMQQLPRYDYMDVATQQMPSARALVHGVYATWTRLFYGWPQLHGTIVWDLADSFPHYFCVLMTAVFVAVPFYALIRHCHFLLVLCFFFYALVFVIYYQDLFSPFKGARFFAIAIVAKYLLVAYGLDMSLEKVTGRIARRTPWRAQVLQSILLLLLCAWPVVKSYSASLKLLAHIHGDDEARASRNEILRSIPVGSKVFLPKHWLMPYISDGLFLNDRSVAWPSDRWQKFSLDELTRRGFDFACIQKYDLNRPVQIPVFHRDLVRKKVAPAYVLPRVSYFLDNYSYVPVQPGDGASFLVGLHFREPSVGDYGGVCGIVPPLATEGDEPTTRNLILNARLFNGTKWWPKFIRWEVSVDGRPIWHGRDTTDIKQVALSFDFQARSGSEIMIRTMRTDHQPDAEWQWGIPVSDLKISGLTVIDAATSAKIPIRWQYVGRHGGPEPEYAMRRDWLHNDSPFPLLDTGFEREHTLAEAWRGYRLIEPKPPSQFPKHWVCKEKSRIEKAAGCGLDGSDAVRFVVEYPAKESATLGIMQPIAFPASQRVRRIRIHYRADGSDGNRGLVDLRLIATGRSLSGEYIDRARISAPVVRLPDKWYTLELDVDKTWKRKHTRIDLIVFLEVSIELMGGQSAVFNYLIDKVEIE